MATDTSVAFVGGLGTPAFLANGGITSGGNAVDMMPGFTPRSVTIFNLTDNVVWTWKMGFPAGTTIKEAAGAQTVDTSGAIVVGLDAGLQEPGTQVILSAAAAGTGKVLVWECIG